tara:strand:+ start:40 stop:420 length:381 start_codon:yes stop_codon:yes gene_type:complete
MPKTEYTPKPRPKPKPKKPPTPAARKGGPKKENLGRGMKGYNLGGAVKGYNLGGPVTEDARAKMMQGVDGQVRGYNMGGQVMSTKMPQQGGRTISPRAMPARPMPQESRMSGRAPGMSKGGRVKKK